jgi:hypothetical protein
LARDSDMAFEVSYNLDNEQQFWDGESACNPTTGSRSRSPGLTSDTELDDIVSTRCQEHEIIDNSLRSFLNVTTSYKCMLSPLVTRVVIDGEQPSTSKQTIASRNASSACWKVTSMSPTRTMCGDK